MAIFDRTKKNRYKSLIIMAFGPYPGPYTPAYGAGAGVPAAPTPSSGYGRYSSIGRATDLDSVYPRSIRGTDHL